MAGAAARSERGVMIKAKSIRFDWSETANRLPCPATGKTFEGGNVWAKANCFLRRRAVLLPQEMIGYLKHGFTVVFEDGVEYSGRYDLKPYAQGFESLDEHVRGFAEFHAGLRRPAHMSKESYASFLDRTMGPNFSESEIAVISKGNYARFLKERQIGDIAHPVPSGTLTCREVEVSFFVPETMSDKDAAKLVDRLLKLGAEQAELGFDPRFEPAEILEKEG